jgi:hypothetical protein
MDFKIPMCTAQDHNEKKSQLRSVVAEEPLARLMMSKHTWRGWPPAENSVEPQLPCRTHFLKHRAPTKAISRMQNKYSNKNTQAYGNIKHEKAFALPEGIKIYHTHKLFTGYSIQYRETTNYSRLQISARLKFSLLFQNYI